MKVNNISNNTSFGRLKINIDKNVLNSPSVKKELAQIKKIFTENGFSRKRNVNVILEHENGRGFFGIIESKKQGIPENPDYRHFISSKKKDIKSFGEWLNAWDYSYSPNGLREWAEIRRRAAESLKKHFHIVSIWRI